MSSIEITSVDAPPKIEQLMGGAINPISSPSPTKRKNETEEEEVEGKFVNADGKSVLENNVVQLENLDNEEEEEIQRVANSVENKIEGGGKEEQEKEGEGEEEKEGEEKDGICMDDEEQKAILLKKVKNSISILGPDIMKVTSKELIDIFARLDKMSFDEIRALHYAISHHMVDSTQNISGAVAGIVSTVLHFLLPFLPYSILRKGFTDDTVLMKSIQVLISEQLINIPTPIRILILGLLNILNTVSKPLHFSIFQSEPSKGDEGSCDVKEKKRKGEKDKDKQVMENPNKVSRFDSEDTVISKLHNTQEEEYEKVIHLTSIIGGKKDTDSF